ncbi:MAG: hypothetical protein AAF405_02555 [Pseudomonadota bacterium]
MPEAKDDGWTSDGYVATSALAAASAAQQKQDGRNNAGASGSAQKSKPAGARTVGDTRERFTIIRTPQRSEPVIDRIAAAQPPQRRGLFSRTNTSQRAAVVQKQPKVRKAQNANRNRGLFARLKGRNKPAQRALLLGPAR